MRTAVTDDIRRPLPRKTDLLAIRPNTLQRLRLCLQSITPRKPGLQGPHAEAACRSPLKDPPGFRRDDDIESRTGNAEPPRYPRWGEN